MQIVDKSRDNKTTAVLAIICAVLQLAIAPNINLGNGCTNFALIFCACVALMRGGGYGVVAGFLAGLFFDLSTTGPLGVMSFCLAVCAYVLGLEGRDRIAGNFASSLWQFAIADLAVSFVYHLAMLLTGDASSLLDVIVYRTLPTALLTWLFFIPFAYVLSKVRVTSQGPNLGGGKHSKGATKRRGKRYKNSTLGSGTGTGRGL